jgi:tetratricopeptide (TPR) repeat protein
MPIDNSPAGRRRAQLTQWWDKLVVSLELADLSDPQTRARLDQSAAAAHNQGLRSLGGWQYADALKLFTAAIDIWSRLGQDVQQANALTQRGTASRKIGDYPAAVTDHQTALELAQTAGHLPGQVAAAAHLGLDYAEQGDLAQAETRLTDAVALSESAQDNWGKGHAQGYLGRVYEAQKNWEAALRVFGLALEQWQALQASPFQIEMAAGLARVALAQGYTMDALGLIEPVLSALGESGPLRMDEPLWVYWSVYRVLFTARQIDDAHELLAAAHYLLEQQTGWLPEELRPRFLDAVAVNRWIVEAWSHVEK